MSLASWYKCPICHILLESVNNFIVHQFKHGDDANDLTAGDRLIHSSVRFRTTEQDGAQLPNSTDILTPTIRLTAVEKRYSEHIVQIQSPIVLLPFIDVASDDNIDFDDDGDSYSGDSNRKKNTACPYCDDLFDTDKLKCHLTSCVMGPGPLRQYRCPVSSCPKDKRFSASEDLWQHFESCHQSPAGRECQNCFQRYPTLASYNFHITRTKCFSSPLKKTAEEVVYGRRGRNGKRERIVMINCDYCKLRIRKKLMSRHLLTCKRKNLKLRCPVNQCPTLFHTDTQFSVHFESLHSDITAQVRGSLSEKLASILGKVTNEVASTIVATTSKPPSASLNQTASMSKPSKFPSGRIKVRRKKSCPLCFAVMDTTNMARHIKICGNRKMKSKSISIKNRSRSITPAVADSPVKTEYSCQGTEDLDLVDTMVLRTEKSNVDNSFPTNRPSRKVIFVANVKKQKIIKMQFLTRCRFCRIQFPSSTLSKHLSKCKNRKKQEGITSQTQRRSNEKIRSRFSEDLEMEMLEKLECEIPDSVSLDLQVPINEIESKPVVGKITHEESSFPPSDQEGSKFRPRTACPICGSIQVSGNLEGHLKLCEAMNAQNDVKYDFGEKKDIEKKLKPSRVNYQFKTAGQRSERQNTAHVTQKRVLSKYKSCGLLSKNGSYKRVVQCPQRGCTVRVSSKFALQVHVELCHRGRRQYSCESCGKSFAIARSLRRHFNENEHSCGQKLDPISNKDNGQETSLETPFPILREKLTTSVPSRASILLGKNSNETSQCTVTIQKAKPKPSEKPSGSGVRAKVAATEVNEKIACEACGMFVFKRNMNRHLQACRRQSRSGVGQNQCSRRYACADIGCDVLFLNSADLQEHRLKIHLQTLNFKCEPCGKILCDSMDNINKHMQTCQNERSRNTAQFNSNLSNNSITRSSRNSVLTPRVSPKKAGTRKIGSKSLRKRHSKTKRHPKKKALQPNTNQWNCIFCMQGFESPVLLADHIRNECHPSRKEKTDEEDPLVTMEDAEMRADPEIEAHMECGYCHNEFTTRETLMQHFRTPCTFNSGLQGGLKLEMKVDPDPEDNSCLSFDNEVLKISAVASDGVVIKAEGDLMINEIVSKSASPIDGTSETFIQPSGSDPFSSLEQLIDIDTPEVDGESFEDLVIPAVHSNSYDASEPFGLFGQPFPLDPPTDPLELTTDPLELSLDAGNDIGNECYNSCSSGDMESLEEFRFV